MTSSSIEVTESPSMTSSSMEVTESPSMTSSSMVVTESLSRSSASIEVTESHISPSISGAQAQSRPSDKPQIETVDFMEKENIEVTAFEYCVPIHSNDMRKRQYYDSIRPMVPGNDSNTFFPNVKHCKFTILNYNVLSQQLLLENLFLYKYCADEYLEWEYRWNMLQYEIKRMNPSILTLQEVDKYYYNSHFLPWLSYYGYKGIYKKRTGHKKDGCAIFFKAEVFDVIEHKSVQYRQNRVTELDRDNVGLIVKLTPKEFYEPFCVSTTHFYFNPKRSDIRLIQMVILLAELERLCYTEEAGVAKYCPVILTGDFNSDPSSLLVQFLCHGILKYGKLDPKYFLSCDKKSKDKQLIPPSLDICDCIRHSVLDEVRCIDRKRDSLLSLTDRRKMEESLISLDKPSDPSNSSPPNGRDLGDSQRTLYHIFNFKSVYNFTPGEVTTFLKSWITTDYIFYSQHEFCNKNKLSGNHLVLLEKYKLPGLSFASKVGTLPSGFCPSDHFPLAATFALSKQSSTETKG